MRMMRMMMRVAIAISMEENEAGRARGSDRGR